jgi:hypothetical protein
VENLQRIRQGVLHRVKPKPTAHHQFRSELDLFLFGQVLSISFYRKVFRVRNIVFDYLLARLSCLAQASFNVFQRLVQYHWGHPIPEWQVFYKKRGGSDNLRRKKPNEYFPIALREFFVGEDWLAIQIRDSAIVRCRPPLLRAQSSCIGFSRILFRLH